MRESLRATRIVKVQGLASVPANTTSPNPLRLDWPTGGTVVWVIGGVSAVATADLAQGGITSLGFRIQIRGKEEFVTSGVGADYVQFSAAFPSAGFRLPIHVRVKQNDAWFVFIRNTHASQAFTPDFGFGVDERAG